MSHVLPWPIALIPYYFIGYWMMSGTHNRDPSPERIFIAIQVYTFGVIMMVLTDAQRFIVLKERRGLITHCMAGWSRNLNYLGEIMLYASFGIMCQRWEVWFIYSYMWGIVFVLLMQVKEYSNSRKAGWEEYKAKTWLLFPKIYNNAVISWIFYTLFFVGGLLGLSALLLWEEEEITEGKDD